MADQEPVGRPWWTGQTQKGRGNMEAKAIKEEPAPPADPIRSRKLTPPPQLTPDLMLVSRICSAKGCKRVATLVHRFLDMWLSRCDFHRNRKMVLDFKKIKKA